MAAKTLKDEVLAVEPEPNQKVSSILLALLAVAVLIASYVAFSFLPDRTLVINNKRVNVLLADTSAERAKGLSDRDRMNSDQGMLFVFDTPSQYCFWMKDMKFPIDMVWLNKDKKIITIRANATPDSYPDTFCPDEDAQYVLEISAGQAANLHIKEGDQAQFKL